MPNNERGKPHKPLGDPGDPEGMCVLLGLFLDYLRVRNFSERTIHHRLLGVNRFIAWAADRGVARPAEVTRPVVERYQRHLSLHRKADGRPLSFRSQMGYLVSVRCWFRWLARQGRIGANPAADLDMPRPEFRLPKAVLTAQEAECVLAVPCVDDPLGLRDRAIMEVLYSTGIRRMELVGLALHDLDRGRGLLLVRQGKGKKDRLVPIGVRAVAWIDRYLEEARPRLVCGGRSGDTLFLTEAGEAVGLNWLSGQVARHIDAAAIGKRGGCHLFRHTMATLMLEGGADIRIIQHILGHACLNTTMLYTHIAIGLMKSIHAATHPAGGNYDGVDDGEALG